MCYLFYFVSYSFSNSCAYYTIVYSFEFMVKVRWTLYFKYFDMNTTSHGFLSSRISIITILIHEIHYHSYNTKINIYIQNWQKKLLFYIERMENKSNMSNGDFNLLAFSHCSSEGTLGLCIDTFLSFRCPISLHQASPTQPAGILIVSPNTNRLIDDS